MTKTDWVPYPSSSPYDHETAYNFPESYIPASSKNKDNTSKKKMSRTDWIEVAAKENWPAARVRNVVKAIKEERVRKYGVYRMVPPNAPAKRMTREDGIFWLSQQAKIPLDQFKMTRPVQFLAKYFLGGSWSHRDAQIKAIEIVHGTSVRGMTMPEDAGCASDWVLEFARKQYLVEDACTCFALGRECECDHAQEAGVASADLAAAPAPPPAPAPAPAADDVNSYVEGHDAPPPAPFVVVPEVAVAAPPAAPAEDGDGYEVYPHREILSTDADDHLFEPPPAPLPTITEVAERLASLCKRVEAHVADAQQRFEDRAALNRLSDRLVASEMELGLIDDALDHMHAGQQSASNVVGRLAAIITRITTMNL